MIPVYYFNELPEQLPEDDACYIVSKYIYLKKKSGLIDSLVRVDSIDMGIEIPEFARMNLPKIKAAVFGKVLGFFKMVYGKYKTEAGTILNLKTHPENPNLKKIDFTIPHQKVSGGGCHYQIVVSPKYINCGTIHSHSDFGAFHSGTDQNDERYFDGLHITVGHVNHDEISIAACVVVNGKRVKVDPTKYIEGIEYVRSSYNTVWYRFLREDLIQENIKDLDLVAARAYTYTYPTGDVPLIPRMTAPNYDTNWFRSENKDVTKPCQECIFKEIKLEDELNDIVFDDEDDSFAFSSEDKDIFERRFSDDTPIFKAGEIDEDEVTRHNNRITTRDFDILKKENVKNSIKCQCGTTFFVNHPEISNICPSCETKHPGKSFTLQDAINMKKREELVGK